MVLQKTWNNTVYNIPQSGERGWATLTNFLTALADGAQTTGKQLIGRRTAIATPVTVTATTDCYIGVNISLAAAAVNLPVGVNGQVFIVADESGAGATYNITITPNGANTIDGGASFVMNQDKQVAYLVFNNGNWVVLHTGTSSAPVTGVTDSTTIDFTVTAGNLTAIVKDDSITNAKVNSAAAIAYSKLNLAASVVDADIATTLSYAKLNLADSIVNADINSAAAIAYSKLNLTGTIVNADVSASAAIVYSKLSLANSIVNADINASAAIAYSKLNLATSIVNADVAVAAAIARNKIANGTADHVVINDGSGTLSSEAQLAKTRGGTGISSTATFPASGVVVTEAATETLTNKTLSGNTATNLISGSGTLTLNTTGTITVPNTTDTLVGKATTDTLTNKTLTGPVITNFEQYTNSTVPATPASGSTRLYASSVDNLLHFVNDAGVDTALASGGGAAATSTTAGTITREAVWTSYTPTVAGLGTVSSLTAFYKVLGDSLFIRAVFITGTVSAATASLSIPGSFTISSAKLPNNTAVVGVGGAPLLGTYGGSNGNNSGYVLAAPGTSTSLVYFGGSFTTNAVTAPSFGNVIAGSTSFLILDLEVPIV